MMHTRTTYEKIVQEFGQPTWGPDDHSLDKQTCCWELEGVEIYDWKTDSTPKGQYAWHLNGSDKAKMTMIKNRVELGPEEGESCYTLVKQLNGYFKLRTWLQGQPPFEVALGSVARKFSEYDLWMINEAHGAWEEMYTEGNVTPDELALAGQVLGGAWVQAEDDKEWRQEAKRARSE
jgi:hypothetical protein